MNKYEDPELTIIEFENEDVITSSKDDVNFPDIPL